MMKKISSLVGLVSLCCWAAATQANKLSAEHMKAENKGYMAYKDPKQPIETRINDLKDQMTLEEKVALMAQLDLGNITSELMKQHNIGSVMSGGESVPRVGLLFMIGSIWSTSFRIGNFKAGLQSL
jgi:beta-glucosidase